MEELIEEVERLAVKTSFRGNDIPSIKNIYDRYININQREKFCMSCPGSINNLVKKFKACKDLIIAKIRMDYE